eukprot:Ihof_evm3s192 gene=Ihof_evmTU3s192
MVNDTGMDLSLENDNSSGDEDEEKPAKGRDNRPPDWIPAKMTQRYKESHKTTEKLRREKINISLERLSGLVPQCRTRLSKQDKLSILSQTVNYIRAIRQDIKHLPENPTAQVPEEGKSRNFPDQEWRRLLLENMEDLLHVCTDQGVIVTILPSCREVLGYEPEELINHNLSSLLHAHDREYVMNIIAEKANHFDYVARYQKKNQEYVWLAVKGRWETLKLHKSFMVGVGRRYESLMPPGEDLGNTNYAEYLAKYTLNGRCTYIDMNVRAILGFTPEEYFRKPLTELFHHDELGQIWDSAKGFMDDATQFVVTHRLMTKGGRYRWVETTMWPFINPVSHKPEFFFGKTCTALGKFQKRFESHTKKIQTVPVCSSLISGQLKHSPSLDIIPDDYLATAAETTPAPFSQCPLVPNKDQSTNPTEDKKPSLLSLTNQESMQFSDARVSSMNEMRIPMTTASIGVGLDAGSNKFERQNSGLSQAQQQKQYNLIVGQAGVNTSPSTPVTCLPNNLGPLFNQVAAPIL